MALEFGIPLHSRVEYLASPTREQNSRPSTTSRALALSHRSKTSRFAIKMKHAIWIFNNDLSKICNSHQLPLLVTTTTYCLLARLVLLPIFFLDEVSLCFRIIHVIFFQSIFVCQPFECFVYSWDDTHIIYCHYATWLQNFIKILVVKKNI